MLDLQFPFKFLHNNEPTVYTARWNLNSNHEYDEVWVSWEEDDRTVGVGYALADVQGKVYTGIWEII